MIKFIDNDVFIYFKAWSKAENIFIAKMWKIEKMQINNENEKIECYLGSIHGNFGLSTNCNMYCISGRTYMHMKALVHDYFMERNEGETFEEYLDSIIEELKDSDWV